MWQYFSAFIASAYLAPQVCFRWHKRPKDPFVTVCGGIWSASVGQNCSKLIPVGCQFHCRERLVEIPWVNLAESCLVIWKWFKTVVSDEIGL